MWLVLIWIILLLKGVWPPSSLKLLKSNLIIPDFGKHKGRSAKLAHLSALSDCCWLRCYEMSKVWKARYNESGSILFTYPVNFTRVMQYSLHISFNITTSQESSSSPSQILESWKFFIFISNNCWLGIWKAIAHSFHRIHSLFVDSLCRPKVIISKRFLWCYLPPKSSSNIFLLFSHSFLTTG